MDASPFTGTAWYYARYRVPYPEELIDDIIQEFHLDGRGRLLDLGCGTGSVALQLRHVFEEAIGVDLDAEMIAEARRQSEAANAANVHWLCMAAEDISKQLGIFRLVTCGTSLHWMDRDRVLRLSHDLLSEDGGIAILGGMSCLWEGPEPWQQEVTRVVKKWLGEQRRAGGGAFVHPREKHEQVLERSGFVRIRSKEYRLEHEWDCDSIIGHLYSTSFAAKPLFADRAPTFEQEIRQALLELNPEGLFREQVVFQSLLAWKR